MDSKYLVLDLNVFAKELESHLKLAEFESDDLPKPVLILTEYDIKDILHKSYAKDVSVLICGKRRAKNEESEDLDSIINSHKGRRF